MKATGVEVFVVGATNAVNVTELTVITSDPVSNHYAQVANYQDILQLAEMMICDIFPGYPQVK